MRMLYINADTMNFNYYSELRNAGFDFLGLTEDNMLIFRKVGNI
jgi:hypothetical protein